MRFDLRSFHRSIPFSDRIPALLAVLCLGLGLGLVSGCASSVSSAAVGRDLKKRVESFQSNAVRVRGARLVQSKVVARFYEARGYEPAWPTNAKRDDVLKAIRAIERDGLDPRDYHADTLEALMREGGDADPVRAADLDLLLTDAVAGMIDHVRYGRVRPVSLNAAWNVDPREEAPGLDTVLARIADAGSVAEAIEAEKPRHFIYTGLVGALARLREIESKGGWPTVPAGKSLKPGVSDRRVPRIRARLTATGELDGIGPTDSLVYDTRLQKAVELFQSRHRLDATGVVDKSTVEAMNVSVDHRIAQVRVNLERARWVVGGLDDDFLLVNLPAFKAYLIRGGKNVWETRTQIGKEARQTPIFRANMRTVVFNPDWTVPPTILAEDVLEGMKKGENTIAQKQLTIIDAEGREVSPGSIDWGSATPENFPYTLRQPPGEDNALGRVKFLFPNKYSIYLHDTPRQELFEADRRTFSSGCIRVENALDLANQLLSGQDGWGPAKIEDALATGKTQNIPIEHTIPVLIVYWTVSVGASGEIRYMRDVYDLDRPVLAAMNGRA